MGVLEDDVFAYHSALGIDIGGVASALCPQAFNIYLSYLHLWCHRKARPALQQMAVLKYQCIAAIDYILGAFAKAGTRIDISSDGACALLSQQLAEIIVLANQFVAGRKIEDDIGTCQRKVIAGRRGGPDIFANFDTKPYAIASDKNLRREGEVNLIAGKAQFGSAQVLNRSKPTLLVELVVVGQILLGNDAQNLALLDDGGTVEQQITNSDGQTHDGDDVKLTCEVEQHEHGTLCGFEQEVLPKQVLTCIASKGQFGENNNLHPLPFGQYNLLFYLLDIVFAICHLYRGNCRSDFYKSVVHNVLFVNG